MPQAVDIGARARERRRMDAEVDGVGQIRLVHLESDWFTCNLIGTLGI